jgi:hypothetical protein
MGVNINVLTEEQVKYLNSWYRKPAGLWQACGTGKKAHKHS